MLKKNLAFLCIVPASLLAQIVIQAGPDQLTQAAPCGNGKWAVMQLPSLNLNQTPAVGVWDPVTKSLAQVSVPLGASDKLVSGTAYSPNQQTLACRGGLLLGNILTSLPGGNGAPSGEIASLARFMPTPATLLNTADFAMKTFTAANGSSEKRYLGNVEALAYRDTSIMTTLALSDGTHNSVGFMDATSGNNQLIYEFTPSASSGYWINPPCLTNNALWYAYGEGGSNAPMSLLRVDKAGATPIYNSPVQLADNSVLNVFGSFACSSTQFAVAYKDNGHTVIDVFSEDLSRVGQVVFTGAVHGMAMADDGTIVFAGSDGVYLVGADGKPNVVLAFSQTPNRQKGLFVMEDNGNFAVLIQTTQLPEFSSTQPVTGQRPVIINRLYLVNRPQMPKSVQAFTNHILNIPCSACSGDLRATLNGGSITLTPTSTGFTAPLPTDLAAGSYRLSLTISGEMQSQAVLSAEVVVSAEPLPGRGRPTRVENPPRRTHTP